MLNCIRVEKLLSHGIRIHLKILVFSVWGQKPWDRLARIFPSGPRVFAVFHCIFPGGEKAL